MEHPGLRMMDRCKYFKTTKIECPPEKECLICLLRNKKGDCIKDIAEEKCLEMEEAIAEIWRLFYEQRKTN